MDSSLHGLLVLDKPFGVTSRDAVDRAQRWFPRGTKLGHTGTLDPLATGVLVLCVGHATRLTEYVQDMAKAYETEIVLGARSATDDAEGPISITQDAVRPDRATIESALTEFLGCISQTPPAFSAAKIAGRRAYDLARRGHDVELAPRTIRIDAIEVLAYEYPHLRLEIRCGKGTYIRSLARDLGDRLGVGGYVATLRRTRVGPFAAIDAAPWDAETPRLRPLGEALAALPRLTVNAIDAARLRNGQRIEDDIPGDAIAVFDEGGSLVAIAANDGPRGLKPVKVFHG